MMFVAGVLWASIVGFACGLISNHTAQERKYSQTIDDLNSMMRDKNVSENMRGRLRQFFFNQQKDVDSQELYQKLLVRMSPTLQAEVAFAAYAAFMLRVPFLADAELEFLAAICLACKHVTFGQGEPIGDTQVLYIIRAGVCFINGNVYRIGSSFGEDVLLDDADLAGFYSGFALTFVEASTITRKQLNDVLFKHPEQSVKIRRHKVTLAVRKTLLHLARQRSREKYGRETAGVSIPSLRSMSSSLSDPMLWRAEAEIMHANRREHAVNRDALERSLKRFHFAKRTADERLEPVSKLIVEDMLQRNSDTVLRETAQFMEHTCDSAGITLKMSVDETDDDMVAEMN
ncbi:unnamed protein product [Amoebophrya sp. A25]|nr:unnamed protein product [Amoebophrya sp. A25]|eukprot:GSA25T00015663001.1